MVSQVAFSRAASSALGRPSRRQLSVAPAALGREATQSIQSRRATLGSAAALLVLSSQAVHAETAKISGPKGPVITDLCDKEQEASLPEKTKLPSGLEYQDIKIGKGIKPIKGYQITVNYIAMNAEGRPFDNSLEKAPYDIRFGVGAVIPGLDEGLKTMQVGGIRRLYVPGNLAFPKGLPSAPGRPRVPPGSPVIFDVQLLYIPGFEDDDE